MVDPGFVKKVKQDILSGAYELPFSGKSLDLSDGVCQMPGRPDSVGVKDFEYLGRRFLSVDRGDYNEEKDRENVNNFLGYIDYEILDGYGLDFEYKEGINGGLPSDGKLDSFEFDNRIRVRPVALNEAYRLCLNIGYNQLKQEISGGLERVAFDVSLNVDNFFYESSLKDDLSFGGRIYSWDGTSNLNVQRLPSWVNVNSEGVEREGRVPLEVLSSLVEPYTSSRIVARMRENLIDFNEEYQEAVLLGNEDEQGSLLDAAREEVQGIFSLGLREEMAVVYAVVRKWLVDKSDVNGFSNDQIFSWNPFRRLGSNDERFSDEMLKQLSDVPPKDLIKYYCSTEWRDGELD